MINDTYPGCRVRCEDCGHVRVSADEVVLRLCGDDLSAAYRFRCPTCGLVHVVPATPAVASALLDAGASTEQWVHSAEIDERPTDAPAISVEEVVAFMATVSDDLALEAALGALS